MDDTTKRDVECMEDGSHAADLALDEPPTPEEEKHVIRKLDWRLMPMIFAIYSLSVLDRSNLGNAHVAGLDESLGLKGDQYSTLGTFFYVTCELFISQPFSLLVTLPECSMRRSQLMRSSTNSYIRYHLPKRRGRMEAFPRAHLGHLHRHLVCYHIRFPGRYAELCRVRSKAPPKYAGCQLTCSRSIVVLRLLLGATEAMYAGVPVYLSFFYPRDRVGFRQGIFLSGSALANAYGGALGYAIVQIKSHLAPWRILFLIEGLPTLVMAVVAWFCFPDDIESAKFLSDREKQVVKHMVSRDQTADVVDHVGLRVKDYLAAFKDWRSKIELK